MQQKERYEITPKIDSIYKGIQDMQLAQNTVIYDTILEISSRILKMNARRKDGVKFSAENISFSPIVFKLGTEELPFKLDIGKNMYHEFDLENCQFQANSKLSADEIQNLQVITMLFMEVRAQIGSKISSSEHPFEIKNKGEKFQYENAKYSFEMDEKNNTVKLLKPVNLKQNNNPSHSPSK